MVAAVAGGVAADYIEICEALKDCSLDEIIEIVLSNPEVFNLKKEDSQPANPARNSQENLEMSTPTENPSSNEHKPEPEIVKIVPQPSIDEKKPEQESPVFPPALKKKAEQVAEIMGGSF